MTTQEAVDILKANEERKFATDYCRIKDMAISALEKEIPRKPKGDYHSCPHYRCPSCNSSVKMYDNDNTYPHCAFCGQALDWSEK